MAFNEIGEQLAQPSPLENSQVDETDLVILTYTLQEMERNQAYRAVVEHIRNNMENMSMKDMWGMINAAKGKVTFRRGKPQKQFNAYS